MESIVQDVRYTVRKLWTTPTFAVAAVLTLALGIGALGASQLLGSLLYGVTASDPSTYVGVVAILAAVGLAACYFPAREGSRVDPMTVLRTD